MDDGQLAIKLPQTITRLLYLEAAASERPDKETTDDNLIIYQEDAVGHPGTLLGVCTLSHQAIQCKSQRSWRALPRV
jgi:hypothetical protein